MAFMDSILEFWDGQALTVQEESRTNGNILDLEVDTAGGSLVNTDSQLGFLYWNLTVGTAAGGLGNGGYFQLMTSDSATFASGSKLETVIGSIGSNEDPRAVGEFAAGAKFSQQIPLQVLKRYVQLEWIPISEAASALVVNSWLGMEPVSPLNIQKEPT